jgi:hypothetical protein
LRFALFRDEDEKRFMNAALYGVRDATIHNGGFNLMKKFAAIFSVSVLALGMSAFAQTAGSDAKAAGSDVKDAGKNVGHATVKGTKATGKAVAKGTKKTGSAIKKGTHKTADAVAGKTQ